MFLVLCSGIRLKERLVHHFEFLEMTRARAVHEDQEALAELRCNAKTPELKNACKYPCYSG